ncbi:hypothetical protein L227DRAFT_576155 [Lentinus tigrinus ALCF2SS1-6]|uniref:Uncharacterized protein n=1 Tax=Lentinus tigrinus ALCF2SS1-6 TaxID=1328759 RepID=A0A5C2S8X4_9APHY|nr:hypothetical protein L227DRAFT_576155 [Lentinus tigrinus ALCF2SS1-6]
MGRGAGTGTGTGTGTGLSVGGTDMAASHVGYFRLVRARSELSARRCDEEDELEGTRMSAYPTHPLGAAAAAPDVPYLSLDSGDRGRLALNLEPRGSRTHKLLNANLMTCAITGTHRTYGHFPFLLPLPLPLKWAGPS